MYRNGKRTKNWKTVLKMEIHNVVDDNDDIAIRTSLRGEYCPIAFSFFVCAVHIGKTKNLFIKCNKTHKNDCMIFILFAEWKQKLHTDERARAASTFAHTHTRTPTMIWIWNRLNDWSRQRVARVSSQSASKWVLILRHICVPMRSDHLPAPLINRRNTRTECVDRWSEWELWTRFWIVAGEASQHQSGVKVSTARERMSEWVKIH